MKASSFFSEAAQKVGAFHLNHRGVLGVTFGIAAGVGLSYTGFGQEAVWAVTGYFYEEAQLDSVAATEFSRSILESVAALTTLGGILTDVALHKYRRNKGAAATPEP